MFIEKDDNKEITIFYKKEGLHYIAYSKADFEKGVKEDVRAKFSSVVISMRPLTWELFNDINEAAVVKSNLGDREWNYKLYKENKLKTIIIGWDAKKKNEKGELVQLPVNSELILNMAPEIAEIVLSEYDSIKSED